MIFLKSIPLSLSVYWRLLVILPVLLPLAFIAALAFSSVWVFLAWFYFIVAQVFVSLVGIRAAFQALGEWNPPSFDRLLVAAFKWGLVFCVLGLAIFLMAGALAVALTRRDALSLLRLVAGNGLDDWIALGASGTVLGLIFLGAAATYYLMSAALTVPMAASAHAATEGGRPLGLMWTFGARVPGILAVYLVALAVSLATGSVVVSTNGFAFAATVAVALVRGEGLPVPSWPDLARFAAMVLIEFWTYAWAFAVAALAFVSRRDEAAADSAVVTAGAAGPAGVVTPAAVDLRALRKSREQS
jgi:hypothetical protein